MRTDDFLGGVTRNPGLVRRSDDFWGCLSPGVSEGTGNCPARRYHRGKPPFRCRKLPGMQYRPQHRRGDARGEAPCRDNKNSPFPSEGRALFERGSGGWGQKDSIEGRVNRRHREQIPPQIPGAAGQNRPTPEQVLLRVPEATRKAYAAWAQSRGCKGRSPLQR